MTDKQKFGIFRYLVPHYDEVTLFSMGFTCGLLLISGAISTKVKIAESFSTEDTVEVLAIIVFFLAGLVLSIYHAFTDRPKTSFEKLLMLFFAVTLNGFSGILAGSYYLESATGWMTVFPVINIINGAVLLIMLRSRIINDRNISDENASRPQVALAATAIVILFTICRYVFNLMWTETLSVCVVYATNVSRVVQTLFFTMMPGKRTA